jgi:glycosyltransferase involved in cell wall biosynthesis
MKTTEEDHTSSGRAPRVCMAEFSDVRFDARVFREACSLCAAGYAVDLFMYNEAGATSIVQVESGLRVMQTSFTGKSSNSSPAQRMRRLARAAAIIGKTNWRIAWSDYDIYHVHNLKYALSSACAAHRRRAPLVYDAHELHYAHYEERGIKNICRNRLGELIERRVLRQAAAVIEASAERAEAVAAHYGRRDSAVVRNTPLYVDCSSRSPQMREELSISESAMVAFYSGGIYAAGGRRLDKVIEAISLLEGVHLVVVGFMSDRTESDLKRSVGRLGIADRVHLRASLPSHDLVRYASGADIGVIPLAGSSLNTHLSALNKVPEYLMAGLALACSDYPILRRMTCGSPAGLLGSVFDVSSPESIAMALSRLVVGGRLGEIRQRALSVAARDWRWDVDERALLKVYESLPARRVTGHGQPAEQA